MIISTQPTIVTNTQIAPNDSLFSYDESRRLPFSNNPSTFFRDEYCWYFNNISANTHVYNSLNELQYQYDEPVGTSNIQAKEAWAIKNTSINTLISIIDYGFDIGHEDLIDNIYLPGLSIGDYGELSADISDPVGHGTMVLSTLAANGNNEKGACGILWKAKILPIKVSARIPRWANAINHAVDNGAKIISISDGFGNDSNIRLAIQRAAQYNCIIVCAALDENTDHDLVLDYPASWHEPNVIIVSSSTRNESIYGAAAFGKNSVHLFAPGRLIIVASPGNNYRYTSGTSFATPMVAGALALIMEKYPNEPYKLTIKRLLDNVDRFPVYTDKCISGGRLNLYKPLVNPINLESIKNPSTVDS